MEDNDKLVAVVVPLSDRDKFLPEEEVSLRHLTHYLGGYDKYLIAPESVDISYPGCLVRKFDDRYFGSLNRHIRLLFKPEFYRSFSEYKYILIYHLDALVLSDSLRYWCDKGYDYIGAPVVFRDKYSRGEGVEPGRDMLLNGGFSLRKVETFIRILEEFRRYFQIPSYVDPNDEARNAYLTGIKRIVLRQLGGRRVRNFSDLIWDYFSQFLNDDAFWTLSARDFDASYDLAPLDDALAFAFETDPSYCHQLNGGKVPFGVHAWSKYEPNFWQPYLLC